MHLHRWPQSFGAAMPALLLAVMAVAGCQDGAPTPADKSAANRSASAPAAGPTAPAPLPADAPVVLAFGDSLYAGYGVAARDGFVPELERALAAAGRPARVVNAGVSGDTTAAGRARLAFTLDGLDAPPTLVLVGLGGNDMLRGLAPTETRANLDAILTELGRRRLRVLMTGMLAAPNMGADYRRAFDPIFPALARKHGAALYPFFLDGAIGKPALMQADSIHPNAAGVDAIVAKVAPIVAQALPKE